jgi:hypothetical protein
VHPFPNETRQPALVVQQYNTLIFVPEAKSEAVKYQSISKAMGKRSRKTANATRKRVLSASNGVVKATEERKPGKVVDTAKILASNPTPEVVNQPHEPVNRQSSSNIPLALEMILPLLSQKQQILVKILCSSLLGQAHIFEQWPVDGDAEKKIECVRQLESFHDSYSAGGLTGFILEAMKKPKKTSNMAKSSDVILEFQDLNSLGFVYVDKGEGKVCNLRLAQ